ncbi:MAG TPA: SPOR domain-containing protein, partial [Trueperaceae bacterium]|nr:SPOR domain-containing protein [Trueperaceae bacterium]
MRGRSWLVAAVVSLAAALVPALAQSISYTVQVVALSDREAALNLQSDLIREGFPAYVVRSTSAQGDVFRVRVGAFANRAAALRYASGMPVTGGGQPVPALAEAIPPGITPLAPLLLVELPFSGRDVAVDRLGEALVIRSQVRADN